ncbi:MFS transporter [Amycolatopsis endophytica]|uniref:MFS family permease n=1 Tax=Amycolatopsis endophytica TaxID=860233 RepID=A0A853AZM9_9PSEU|nr:MFS transporter [Amycolatopsis endophytica]NYI88109.1 MFS family permease [Amycolatopsis endophytica]
MSAAPATHVPGLSTAAKTKAMTAVCLAQFAVVLDSFVGFVALPSIQRDLGFSGAGVTWVINSYILVFGGFLVFGGRCADVIGQRVTFLWGTGIFAVTSVICGLSVSPYMLVGARFAQGLGAALMAPAALAILVRTFHDGPGRRRALTLWGIVSGCGATTGLVAGGALVDLFSWPSIFFVNLPVCVAILVLARRSVPPFRLERGGRFDFLGAIAVTGALLALVYAVISVESAGWTAPPTLGALALALLLGGMFVLVEHVHPNPMIELRMFRVRSLTVANLTLFLLCGAPACGIYVATMYLQNVMMYSSGHTGLVFLPASFAVVFGSFAAQRFIPLIGVRRLVTAAAAIAAAGSVLLGTAGTGPAGMDALMISGAVFVLYLGASCVSIALRVLATSDLDVGDVGAASGLINTAQQVGAAFWLAVFSSVVTRHVANGSDAPVVLLSSTYELVAWASSGLAVLSAIVAAAALPAGPGGRSASSDRAR